MTNATQTQNNFFDLITKGCGFVNRIRAITKNRRTFYAMTFVANRGEVDESGKCESTRFELLVKGSKAKEQIIKILEEGYKSTDKVWACLELGDVHMKLNEDGTPAFFTADNGKHVVSLSANLLKIKYMKVNNEVKVNYQVNESKPATDVVYDNSDESAEDTPANSKEDSEAVDTAV